VAGSNAVRAVDREFLKGERFDVGENFVRPGRGDGFVAEDGAAEFVAGLVGEDCGLYGVGELCDLSY